MQISNNTNTSFKGTFGIKANDVKTKMDLPQMFTQGRQIFHDILEKGDEFIVLRDKSDKRVGKYLKDNNVQGVKYYPKINTSSGLDDEKPEGLIQLVKDKAVVVKTGLDNIISAIAEQKLPPKPHKIHKEIKKISNALRLNIENPLIQSNRNYTSIRDNHKERTIEVIAINHATSYVYVKPDSLNEDSIKCIIDGKGNIAKIFTTPNDITKFMKIFRELKNSGCNILVR